MEDWNVAWWHWMLAGIGLLVLELLTPGSLFLIFFGAAALVVGLLSFLGLAGPLWLQIVLFTVLSVVALFTLRRLLRSKMRFGMPAPAVDQLVGDTAITLEDIPIDALGKVELRGAAWSARNTGQSNLSRGARCKVLRVEGLTLWVYEELGM